MTEKRIARALARIDPGDFEQQADIEADHALTFARPCSLLRGGQNRRRADAVG